RPVYCTIHKKAGMIHIQKTSRTHSKTAEEENISERGTAKSTSAKDTTESSGTRKKRSLTNEKQVPSSEGKDHEPAAGDTAKVNTSNTKTPRAPVVIVKKTVTKTAVKRHTKQEQREASSAPGAGGKKQKKVVKVKG
ncbi:unnamed protein product, partial [Sphacelaria rigidula]